MPADNWRHKLGRRLLKRRNKRVALFGLWLIHTRDGFRRPVCQPTCDCHHHRFPFLYRKPRPVSAPEGNS